MLLRNCSNTVCLDLAPIPWSSSISCNDSLLWQRMNQVYVNQICPSYMACYRQYLIISFFTYMQGGRGKFKSRRGSFKKPTNSRYKKFAPKYGSRPRFRLIRKSCWSAKYILWSHLTGPRNIEMMFSFSFLLGNTQAVRLFHVNPTLLKKGNDSRRLFAGLCPRQEMGPTLLRGGSPEAARDASNAASLDTGLMLVQAFK